MKKLALTKKPERRILLLYTEVWVLLAGFLALIFLRNGRSFVWGADGKLQHYPSFEILCGYVERLFHGEGFTPLFNLTLGQGQDVIGTLGAYDIFDPVSWLAAFCVFLPMLGRYTLLVFLKLYLMGISFITYCFSIEKKEWPAVLSGAIAYTFSGAVLYTIIRHPIFVCWAYFLPFLLAGVEYYERKGKQTPLVLCVFFHILTSYYAFYMNVVLTVFYVLIHSIFRVIDGRKTGIRKAILQEFRRDLRLAGVMMIGGLLSAFCLFPVIHAYANNYRVGMATGYIDSLFHWPLFYYQELFEGLFAPFYFKEWYTAISLNIVLFVPLVLIFRFRKRYREQTTLVVLCGIMLCVPLAGRILNGFGYPSNRWGYAVPFFASVSLVLVFEELRQIGHKEMFLVLIVAISYAAVCFLRVETNQNPLKYVSLILILWSVSVLSYVVVYRRNRIAYAVFLLSVAGAFFQIYFTFSGNVGNYVSAYCTNEEMATGKTSSVAAASLEESFYRVEEQERTYNDSYHNGVFGTTTYWSLMPERMLDYHRSLALDTMPTNIRIQGLDARTGLLALASVKYYTCPADNASLIPYAYRETESPDKDFRVFENPYALPVGYVYDGQIPVEEYEMLDGLEKEQALLQGVVVDDDLDGYPVIHPQTGYTVLDSTIRETTGLTWEGATIQVEGNGSIRMAASVPEESEIYIYIRNVHLLENNHDVRVETGRETEGFSVRKDEHIINQKHQWYFERDDICFNLGCGGTGENDFAITFDGNGILSVDSIDIIAVPMEIEQQRIRKLQEKSLQDITVADDHVHGRIELSDNGILQFSIPYHDGWHAVVDGEKRKPLCSGGMYMALPLAEGEHDITLYYRTPFLREGVIVSLCTLILCVGIEVFLCYRRKKNPVC